jgi:hypothetical protein
VALSATGLVAHLLMILACAIYTVGAPSLRLLQGRVAMLPIQLFVPFRSNRVAFAFVVPALRRLREGRGTHLGWSCQ